MTTKALSLLELALAPFFDACDCRPRISGYLDSMPLISKAPPRKTRPRTDGRKTLLVYLDSGLIKSLKKAALDEERNVYEIVEEASRDWLDRRATGAVEKSPRDLVEGD